MRKNTNITAHKRLSNLLKRRLSTKLEDRTLSRKIHYIEYSTNRKVLFETNDYETYLLHRRKIPNVQKIPNKKIIYHNCSENGEIIIKTKDLERYLSSLSAQHCPD